MLRIAVVDDYPKDLEKIKGYLEKYQEDQRVKLKIHCYQSGEDTASLGEK